MIWRRLPTKMVDLQARELDSVYAGRPVTVWFQEGCCHPGQAEKRGTFDPKLTIRRTLNRLRALAFYAESALQFGPILHEEEFENVAHQT